MIVVGKTIEEAFNRLELLVKITNLCIKAPNPKAPLSSSYPFLDSLTLIDSSDEFYSRENESIYERINSFSKRAYDHVPLRIRFSLPASCCLRALVFNPRRAPRSHCSSQSNRLLSAVVGKGSSVLQRSEWQSCIAPSHVSSLWILVKCSFCGFPEIGCIFDCVPTFVSLLMLRGIKLNPS